MNESRAESGVSAEDGHPPRYVQGIARRFRLTASGLRFVGGFESRDGRLEDGRRILAEAHVVGGTLAPAGMSGEAGPIGLTLRPLTASADEGRLLLLIGYREAPFAEAFLPLAVFEQLKGDMLAGLAQELAISATTSLWVRREDRERPEAEPLDWYLSRDGEGHAMAPARGFIESLTWWPRPPADAAAPAQETDDEEDWQAESADQLRRINWSFKQLLLLLVFLMLIVAVK